MKRKTKRIKVFDKAGNSVSPIEKLKNNDPLKKQAFGLYGNIYQFPNYGKYRPRFYVQQDSEQGLDSLSRELLVRWSREITSQMGFIESAIRVLAQFTIGDAYLPEYVGNNPAWGKVATDWLKEEFYPNCCNRGKAFDFQTVMFLESQMLDQDGDLLCIYGKDKNGFPKFQIVPSHRIRSESNNTTSSVQAGPFTDTITSDGVVYDLQGNPIGYNVVNYKNLVNTLDQKSETTFISARDAQLIYDPRYFDKGRGRPSIGSAILQALSLQEIESYLVEKIKIESTVALIEKTPSGEGPQELQDTLAALNAMAGQNGIFNPSPNVHGVEIVDGPSVRYVKANGGDIKTLASSTPADQTSDYITRLETHVLSTLGVPHVLLFSPDEVSGRISDGVGEIFNRSVQRRQKILDSHGKFIIAWALANAMKQGLIPENNNENLYKAFNLTHPSPFSLNAGYDRSGDLADFKAGLKSMNEIVKKRNTTAETVIKEKEKESIEFFKSAQRISKETGVDLTLVIQTLREDIKQTISTPINENES